MHKILLCDPAFRNFGWAIMALGPTTEQVLAVGVVRTEKSEKKRKLLAADDNHRCVVEIVNKLDEIRRIHAPLLICAESQQGSKNAHAVQLQGMAWGALSAFATLSRLSLLQVSPQAVKKAVCGKKDASKEEIEQAVCRRYDDLAALVNLVRPPSVHEHIYDAVAVGVTCLPSETIQTVRSMAVVGVTA